MKVSIVIPIFNSEHLLRKCIESVLGQTYLNFELILVNDGSTDNSLSICNEFLYDKRVKVICQENSGVSVARNTGINYATGDWIMFIDSDDCIESEMLFAMIKVINEHVEENKLDFVFCGFQKDYFADRLCEKILKTNLYFCENHILNKRDFCLKIESFLKQCLLQGPWGKLFNRKIIEEYNIRFNEDLSYGEDTLFVYNYLEHSSNILCMSDTFYHYNVYNNDSLNLRFRKDKLKIHIMLNKKLEKLIQNYNDDYDKLTKSMLISAYISYSGDLCSRDISAKIIYDCFKDINSYNEVIDAFQDADNSLQNRIIRACILNRKYKTEMGYFKLKEKIRRNKQLFNFFLRRDSDYGTY